MNRRVVSIAVILLAVSSLCWGMGKCDAEALSKHEGRWFPVQEVPEGVVVTTPVGSFEQVESFDGKTNNQSTHMMVQSVAGLAAKAVNEGKCDEMVWIDPGSKDYEDWFKGAKHRQGFEVRGTLKPWELVERFRDKGIIRGYVLYSYDYSIGKTYKKREGIDHSVNAATTVAGLVDGILIEEGQQVKAEEMGLKMLYDCRGKDSVWAFNKFRDELNRNMIVTMETKMPHNRAMAIAYQTLCHFGFEEPYPDMLKWLEPLSPVIGWNMGREDQHNIPPSLEGHFQTVSNWAYNLPLLQAGTESADIPRLKSLDPSVIDYDKGDHFTTYVLSDGDNVQWMMGTFVRNDAYWANPHNGEFPFGWSICAGHLAQVCPEVLGYLRRSQPSNCSFVEHGCGYYYPDIFARHRPNRLELLRKHAKRMNVQMNRAGVNTLTFICQKVLSKEAKEAYEIYIEEIDNLVGILAMQYYPYDGGDGEVFWFENSEGVEIPVVTAKFSTWNHARWPRGGTPAKVARLTNEYAQRQEKKDQKSFSFVANHAWSWFVKAPEDANDLDENYNREIEKSPRDQGAVRGLTPIKWLVERLDEKVHPVSPEEFLWRLRMEHDPETTRKAIKAMK